MNPLIGITTSFEDEQQRLDYTYVNAVQRAHGLPVLLPIITSASEAEQFCNLIQGLIVPGGPGIMANSIGGFPTRLNPVSSKRWESDNFILDAAKQQNLPILGICYGMQLLCVRAGGSLVSDVEKQVEGAFAHSEKRGACNHPIEIVQNTYLAQIWDSNIREVNSRHFQAVHDPGTGYMVSARSSDGSVEAIERSDGIHIGVQFHPERMDAQFLFRNLIQQALEYNHVA
ncbi:MAG: gamma-glutamyl-gamma-aminobutyrate hydrolase family protein [Bacteroidetes bacterium]|nr:gamma-glutamyl-gamma-aminobutyrate hydrolase family protein [Bacteroidota bacterium]MCY4206293.1 gamma-glutamyl-gamma-aminobutyrate hydrolase family protein [Bacteroidota bacterium]